MTRWLVVVLLAANLGFMAWMYQRMAQEAVVPTVAGLPGREEGVLRLLSEVEDSPQQDESTGAAVPEAPAAEPADAPAAEPEEPRTLAAPEVSVASEPLTGSDPAPPAWKNLEQLAVLAPPGAPLPSAAREVSPPEVPATRADAPPARAVASSDTCLTLGPLSAEASARRLSDWLVARGGTSLMRPEVTGRPDAHWLYVGPFPDLTAARLESDRLRDLGVTDHLAVRHEQLGPVVSLGLYATKEGRERRIATLQAAGVEPVVVPRGPRETRWWVDARLPPESGLTADAIAAAASDSASESVTAARCEGDFSSEAANTPLTIGVAPTPPVEATAP